MTPAEFAAIMERAYQTMRPWSEDALERTLAQSQTVFLTSEHAGLVAQILADEVEILTLATDPAAQRTGAASNLMTDLIDLGRAKGATRILLEVAEQNAPARAFYDRHGFAEIGRRKGYYTLRDGTKDDALLLSRALP